MSVYILESDDEFQDLTLVDDQDWERINALDGARAASWQSVTVQVSDAVESRTLEKGDFVDLAGLLPLFSSTAAKRLADILSGSGEFLAIECNEGDYLAFNVTNVIDALNESRSDIVYFDSGKVLNIKRFVFNAEALSESVIFKIPQLPLGRVFVTERFVDLVCEAKLRGFLFKPVEVISGDV